MTPAEEDRLEAFRVAVTQTEDLDADACRRLLDAYAGPAGWDSEYRQVEGVTLCCNVRVRIGGRYVTRGVLAIDAVLAGMVEMDPFVAAVKQFGYAPGVIDSTPDVQDTPPPEPSAPEPVAPPTPELPRRWQCPEPGRLWHWLKAREGESLVSVVDSVRRFGREANYPDRWDDWDEHQTGSGYKLCIKLFRKNGVAIEPEPAAPEPASSLKSAGKVRVIHFNELVAFLDDDTGEERTGVVVDQRHDGDVVTGYLVKLQDKSKVWVDAKMLWSSEDDQ